METSNSKDSASIICGTMFNNKSIRWAKSVQKNLLFYNLN